MPTLPAIERKIDSIKEMEFIIAQKKTELAIICLNGNPFYDPDFIAIYREVDVV